jgi:hypothetical protein
MAHRSSCSMRSMPIRSRINAKAGFKLRKHAPITISIRISTVCDAPWSTTTETAMFRVDASIYSQDEGDLFFISNCILTNTIDDNWKSLVNFRNLMPQRLKCSPPSPPELRASSSASRMARSIGLSRAPAALMFIMSLLSTNWNRGTEDALIFDGHNS